MKILGTNFRIYDEEAQRNKHRPFFQNGAESYVSFFVPSKLDAQQTYGDCKTYSKMRSLIRYVLYLEKPEIYFYEDTIMMESLRQDLEAARFSLRPENDVNSSLVYWIVDDALEKMEKSTMSQNFLKRKSKRFSYGLFFLF